MLEGKNVNLNIVEREDLYILKEWINNLNIEGEYEPILHVSIKDLEKKYDKQTEGQWYFIEKKDGTKIGYIFHMLSKSKVPVIGYAIIPSERGNGFCSEAVQIIVDYLYLSKQIIRIQAEIDPENIASQKVLEKVGFKMEGILRKSFFSRGNWRDSAMYSILREEWKEARILLI